MDVKYMTVSGLNVLESVWQQHYSMSMLCTHYHSTPPLRIWFIFFLYFVLSSHLTKVQGFIARYM